MFCVSFYRLIVVHVILNQSYGSVLKPLFPPMPFRLFVESHPVKTCMTCKRLHTSGTHFFNSLVHGIEPSVSSSTCVEPKLLNGQLAEVTPT